jgi:hypothetical protein
MNFVNILAPLVAGTFMISPTIAESPITLTAATVKVDQPIMLVVTTEKPKVKEEIIKPELSAPKKYAVATRTGDCEAYRSLISKYDWDVTYAMAICMAESQGNPDAEGDVNTPYHSYGLMQIRGFSSRPSKEKLFDPEINIETAYKIWKEKGNFCAWSTYSDPRCK